NHNKKSAKSKPCFLCSSVANFSIWSEILKLYSLAFSFQLSYCPKSGNNVTDLFLRTSILDWLSCPDPPQATQMYLSINVLAMMAVFSDSTTATGLRGSSGRRCSPNKH